MNGGLICQDGEDRKRSVLATTAVRGGQEFCFGHVKFVMSGGYPSGHVKGTFGYTDLELSSVFGGYSFGSWNIDRFKTYERIQIFKE